MEFQDEHEERAFDAYCAKHERRANMMSQLMTGMGVFGPPMRSEDLGELEDPSPEECPVRAFVAAVNRAAAELHDQGARSHRIALQLLDAVAKFQEGLEQ